jgi:hypothetical protein
MDVTVRTRMCVQFNSNVHLQTVNVILTFDLGLLVVDITRHHDVLDIRTEVSQNHSMQKKHSPDTNVVQDLRHTDRLTVGQGDINMLPSGAYKYHFLLVKNCI